MQVYSVGLLNKVRQHLKSGGIIAYPCESGYALGCDPFNYRAIKSLIHCKGRPKNKGFIVIAGSYASLSKIILPVESEEEQELNKYWQNFCSLILPVTKSVPQILMGNNHKIAVRVANYRLMQQLCNRLKMPLVSTSANKSGCKPIKSYQECIRQFGKKVIVLEGRIGEAGRPSTLIDWETKRILR